MIRQVIVACLLSTCAVSPQPPQRASGAGIIAGIVINERQEPVTNAEVQAFLIDGISAPASASPGIPFSGRASGLATTDREGRFRISGLPWGDYLVGVAVSPSVVWGTPDATPVYATTFYPSATDYRVATRVSATASGDNPIRLERARVKGARVSGSVTGRGAAGMDVRLFHAFGDFRSESTVGTVGDDGTFAIPRVPPGWYRLTIGARPRPTGRSGEFATRLIEVREVDVEGLSLVLGSGASIAGRVAADTGFSMQSAIGLMVGASPDINQYSSSIPPSAKVDTDTWSFSMTGLSGIYTFTARSDRAPFVKATRITVDGKDAPIAAVRLEDGHHDVVVFVGPRDPLPWEADMSGSLAALVERFTRETVFYKQAAIAKEIVKRGDASVLPSLVESLRHEDRHVRGNAALIFGGLGDPRGLEVIVHVLNDRSDRPEGQGTVRPSSDARDRLEQQISTDRYYAAHLLGDLRDRRAVPLLVTLLNDPDVKSVVPWALGEIGDKTAIASLIDQLDKDDPTTRVLAIYALETLKAKEALPRLTALLDDRRQSNFGAQVSVAEAARAAIKQLREP
jgi:hypothetical protein